MASPELFEHSAFLIYTNEILNSTPELEDILEEISKYRSDLFIPNEPVSFLTLFFDPFKPNAGAIAYQVDFKEEKSTKTPIELNHYKMLVEKHKVQNGVSVYDETIQNESYSERLGDDPFFRLIMNFYPEFHEFRKVRILSQHFNSSLLHVTLITIVKQIDESEQESSNVIPGSDGKFHIIQSQISNYFKDYFIPKYNTERLTSNIFHKFLEFEDEFLDMEIIEYKSESDAKSIDFFLLNEENRTGIVSEGAIEYVLFLRMIANGNDNERSRIFSFFRSKKQEKLVPLYRMLASVSEELVELVETYFQHNNDSKSTIDSLVNETKPFHNELFARFKPGEYRNIDEYILEDLLSSTTVELLKYEDGEFTGYFGLSKPVSHFIMGMDLVDFLIKKKYKAFKYFLSEIKYSSQEEILSEVLLQRDRLTESFNQNSAFKKAFKSNSNFHDLITDTVEKFLENYKHHLKHHRFIEKIHKDRRAMPRDELYSYIDKMYKRGYLLMGYFTAMESHIKSALKLIDNKAKTSRKPLGQLLQLADTEYKLNLIDSPTNFLLSRWNDIKHSNLTETSELSYSQVIDIEKKLFDFLVRTNLAIAKKLLGV